MPSPRTPRRATLALTAGAALLIAGCGGSGDDGGPAATTTSPPVAAGGPIEVQADAAGTLLYEQSELSAEAGKVTIDFENPAKVVHDVTIENADGKQVAATERVTGGSTSLKADLPAGSYTFFCSVTGHRLAGMEGTLDVS